MNEPTPPNTGNFALLMTSTGAGAIAIIRVYGPTHKEALSPHLTPHGGIRRNWRWPSVTGIKLGWFLDGAETIDEVLVRRTEEDEFESGVEICCHGGWSSVRRIISVLKSAGVGLIAPFKSPSLGNLDLEAWQAWVSAKTPLASRVFYDELTQGMGERVLAWTDAIHSRAPGILDLIRSEVGEWLGRFPSGTALSRSSRVVLAGPPNAGKSTLFNALIGRQRALTSGRAGTTRDSLRSDVILDGYPIELWDTPGVHETDSDPWARSAVRLAEEAMNQADLVVWVGDGTARNPKKERDTRFLEVLNKCDMPGFVEDNGVLCISAIGRTGLEVLSREILDRMGCLPASSLVGPTPFLVRHRTFLDGLLEKSDEGLRGPQSVLEISEFATGRSGRVPNRSFFRSQATRTW